MEKATKTESQLSHPMLNPHKAVFATLVIVNCVNASERSGGHSMTYLYYQIKLISLGLKDPCVTFPCPPPVQDDGSHSGREEEVVSRSRCSTWADDFQVANPCPMK